MNAAFSESGPYLVAALICEKVLQEKDETLSAIRIVDRVTLNALVSQSPEALPSTLINLAALISFKSGSAKGRHMVKWTTETPSGITLAEQFFSVLFEGEDRGANLVLNLNMMINQEGVYWFGVYLEDKLLTKIPLRILYQRMGPNQ